MTIRRKPTDGELEILQVLWDRGPSTVREVAEALGRTNAYTTPQAVANHDRKRLVQRRESGRLHITAASSRDQTQRHLVRDLLRRAFDGSAAQLVMQALSTGRASTEELAEIRKLLDQHRGGR